MNWTHQPAAETQPNQNTRLGANPIPTAAPSPGAAPRPQEFRVDKRHPLAAATTLNPTEVFTLTLGTETIELTPSRNWNQLDHHKWTMRGILPAEPAGLEVAADHVKILGETVSTTDPAGCAKLQRLFNDWLKLELETLALARKKSAPAAATTATADAPAAPQPVRFQVEVDKRQMVHIHCWRGKELLATIGLNVAGFQSLQQQGLMRKAHAVATGALRDWVELDGELFSFEKGRDDSARLEQTLNQRYVPPVTTGGAKEILVFPNLVSATGFDLQFPVIVAGALGVHRYHLNDQSLELLHDPQHCGLLHREIIIKLIPPNLVFKRKTPDGGEQYLAVGPETTVRVTDDEGHEKTVELHQPLNLLRLSAAELTAVLNHPAINRHAKPPGTSPAPAAATAPLPTAAPKPAPPPPAAHSLPTARVAAAPAPPRPAELPPAPPTPAPDHAEPPPLTAPPPVVKPNLWLEPLLSEPALAHDWFPFLVYSKMAEWFGNSTEGTFGPCNCWFISLDAGEDISAPDFKGIFLTEKGSFGFMNAGRMARFCHQVAFIGTQSDALEGIEINLAGVALDAAGRVIFITSDDYRSRFGVSEATLASELSQLREHGALIMNAREAIGWREPIAVVWTAPAEQIDPADPQARETVRATPDAEANL